ncbi:MAG: VIT and VWA domain-containing protein [Proteobacteria bacterium]|nr:VIT and VWA domain-containing protein [Pseudomonadota bacterium]
MKTPIRKITHLMTAVFLAICMFATSSMAAGLLKPLSGNKDSIHMKSHRVDVTINNGFARTQVEQIFTNSGPEDLEAIYSFPIPKQASLSELSLWIDGREVMGEVLEKEKAKKVYNDQKAKGNDTALAEKNDHKTFEVKVYPVRANNETTIRLVYYQPLDMDLNVGRYVYPLEEGGVDEERIAFWSVDNTVKESFVFNLELKSAFPVKDIRIPKYDQQAVITKTGSDNQNETYSVKLELNDFHSDSHDSKETASTTSEQIQQASYTVHLDLKDKGTLSKDIVCYYRLEDTVPARLELIPYKKDSNEDGTFMVVVTPGTSLQKIQDGTDWTFVLDISGSMGGEKMRSLVDGVSKVIGSMSGQDRYRIVTFNDNAFEFTGGYIPATTENISKTIAKVNAITASGSTALYSGLTTAYKGLDSERTTGIVLVTDGVANVGPSEHATIMGLLKENDYRLFTFVIGNSANQPLLDALSKNSGGFAMNISSSDDIVGRILQAKAKVLHECLYDAKLEFHGETVKDLTPSDVKNLYMGQQLVLFGKYSHAGQVDVTLTGRIGSEAKRWTCRANLPDFDTTNPEIERLWALSAIDDTMEEIRMKGKSNQLTQRVTDLGTEYSLVTDYTSMVVLNETDMEGLGINRKNADRVQRERDAQTKKASQPARNHRVDNTSSPQGMFKGSRSHSVGSGPVGPLFLLVAYWVRRKKIQK